MRKAIAFVSAILLSHLAGTAHADWQYGESKDEMRGTTNRWAILESNNSVDVGAYRSQLTPLRIVLRDMPGTKGQDLVLMMASGQLDCSHSGCSVAAKFDDGPIAKYAASRARANTNVIFVRDRVGFLKRLREATTAWIEVPVWRHGDVQFQFSPQNLVWK